MSTSTDFQPVVTRAALALQQQEKSQHTFKAYIFDAPKDVDVNAKKATKLDKFSNKNNQETSSPDDGPEFNIKKARNEVLNFAIANQRLIKNKRKMEVFKAIKLGAKPMKKAYKNYKDLLDERKRLKQIREERWKYHQLGKNQTGAASVKCRNKSREERKHKKRAPVSNIDKHYGVTKPNLKRKSK